ncbi:MAG: BACON domain-containing protein [Bacteroidales bacterium]|nr:BACON domain-containing protein [Bacteroidales bacterium]
MKKYRIALLSMTVALMASACTDIQPDVPFGTGDSELSFEAVGGTKAVSISADGEWVASSGEPWITISPANGRGKGTCNVIIDTTLVLEERTGRVNIRKIDDDDIVSINVTQKGFEYSISVDKENVSIPEYDQLDNRYFDVKVKSNIPFDVQIPDDASWLTLDRSNKELELDRGVRPRDVRVRFRWNVSSTPAERIAEVKFVPKDQSATLARHDFLTVTQGAAEEITQSRHGDSLAVLGIGRSIGIWTEYDSSLPMDRWAGVVLWHEDDIDYVRELVADDKAHLLEDQKALADDNPLKGLGEADYLEAVAQSYIGRVREAVFMMFTTREVIPLEVQYLRAAESLTFAANANSFLRSLATGESLNNLTQLRRLAIRAYGLTELDKGLTSLKNLEYIDLASNNFQVWPSILDAANFPKMHSIVFNANQRRVVYDLSNSTETDLGGFMDNTTPGRDNVNGFWKRLLTWEKLDTLILSVNYLQGTLPSDETVRGLGIRNYTEADRGDSLTTDFINLGLPRVMPNMKRFAINYNRMTGDVPMWLLYHPALDYWMPDTFIFAQEGTDKSGNRAEMTNVPISLGNYSNIPGNRGSYYDIHPYKLENKD